MTMEMSEGFYRALRYAKRCGVQVEMVTRLPRNASHQAPTVRACIKDPNKILWQDPQRAGMDDETACALIHDVHHAVVWRLTGTNPHYHDELGAMLALDHKVMQGLRLKWSTWMSTFWFGDDNWMSAPTTERSAALIDSYAAAVKRGWMNARHQPTLRGEAP